MEHNEGTTRAATELARLVMLRDVAVPFAEEMRAQGRLNFGVFGRERACGSEACLLGWMGTLPDFTADGWQTDVCHAAVEWTVPEDEVAYVRKNLLGPPFYRDQVVQDDGRLVLLDFVGAQYYFGITSEDSTDIFGVGITGLEGRCGYIDRVIARKRYNPWS